MRDLCQTRPCQHKSVVIAIEKSKITIDQKRIQMLSEEYIRGVLGDNAELFIQSKRSRGDNGSMFEAQDVLSFQASAASEDRMKRIAAEQARDIAQQARD